MKYLYRYKVSEKKNDINKLEDVDCKTFTPNIWKMFLPGEKQGIEEIGVRLLFQILTLGRAKIYYVSDDTNLLHTSYVVPKCGKFTFMNKDDYEIGPCFTYPQYRGKGIYPAVVQAICNRVGNCNTTFYMIVEETNVASIKGIEKAGFEKCGLVKVTKFTKRYLLDTNFDCC